MPRKQQREQIDIIIGHKLENLRKNNNISRSKLAIDSQIDVRTLGNCEKGYNKLTIPVLRKLYDNFFVYKNYDFTDLFRDVVSNSYLIINQKKF